RALCGEAGYDEGPEGVVPAQRRGYCASHFIERRRLGRGKPVFLVAVGDHDPPGLHRVTAEAGGRWLAKPDQGPVDAGDSGDAIALDVVAQRCDDRVAAERFPY